MNMEKDQLKDIYDDITLSIESIMKDPDKNNLNELCRLVNKFFEGSTCVDVLYTPNTDGLFFGIYVVPVVNKQDVLDILFKNKRYIVTKYYVELDSKMFTGQVMLTSGEITALLIHEIAHMVNDSSPAEIVKKEIDKYLAKNNEVLKVTDSAQYATLLAYGFADAMRKYSTIFEMDHYTPNGTIDEFIDWLDFTNTIRSAFNKLNVMWCNYNREVLNKFITLSWILRIYKDIKHNRIPALEAIKRCIEISPSTLEKKELRNLADAISHIDDDALLESKSLQGELYHIIKSIREDYLDQPRYKYNYFSIRECMEDDIDRLIDMKDNYNEPDVIPELLHCMNKKMSLIQDYVDHDEAMTPSDFKQWDVIFRKLDRARKDLTNGNLYSNSKSLINTYTKYGEEF